ncbi:hypothetical protein GE21DRAFT_9680 [Neurospora crassa]|uniref:RecQ mediated genome instability protein Rmi1 n=1 Tax=Neurospora crassa (strain ATCC 24698 / 74-OR23-1A / CBS 708.71 / DSM 1257 / FGSC 987) TaxID=367110 RepID=Q7S1X6_NEUCR|nr:RecQ mediated genome instability protein Rmi1 [Neurospora crassa OR74A]EAA29355.1 RecQ mediated genome instability protein Rmi1 [Neurospora crassa OR74A]KHE87233.1 hypothetical protein GE21DRAFT_9680 [Neurospora crassa]|eukprot:XP_958591.1 RecQ mediated genome instability protein Rmi1 [Neurospora crassa OR74A]
METARTLHRQLTTDSHTTFLPIPSLSWLTTLIPSTTSRNIPPLPSLLATARLRLLSSDLSTPGLLDPSYVSSHSFPPSLTSGQQHPPTGYPKDQTLPQDVLVQVLDIVNLSRSKWEVVEELESIERGEQTRGREVIRLPTTSNSSDPNDPNDGVDMGDGGTQTQAAQQQAATAQAQQQAQQAKDRKNATHKITLQDCSGQRLYALELKRIEEIAVPQFVNGKMVGGTPIGCKLLLRKGTKVARGVVLLEPGRVKVLGGRVEGWGRVWEQGRFERVRGEVQAQRG